MLPSLFFPLWNTKLEYLQTFEDTGSLHVTLKMYLMPVKQKLYSVVTCLLYFSSSSHVIILCEKQNFRKSSLILLKYYI